MKKSTLALGALCLLGCSEMPGAELFVEPVVTYRLGGSSVECRDLAQPVDLTLDTDWSGAEMSAILAAADSWSEATGIRWQVCLADCDVNTPDKIPGCVIKGGEAFNDPALLPRDGVTLFATEIDAHGHGTYLEALEGIARHEIGHYLGIPGHLADPGAGVMGETVDGNEPITAEDVDLFDASCTAS